MSLFTALACAEVVQPGDRFPLLYLNRPSEPADQNYLGLLPEPTTSVTKGVFTLTDITAELIVLEFLNRYCPSCQAQMPIMNVTYGLIEKNPELKHKVKILGVGSGNNDQELKEFKIEQSIPFPLIHDPEFIAYDAIGDPGGTPFTILVRKVDNRCIILSTHLGRINSAEELLKDIHNALTLDPASLQALAAQTVLPRGASRALSLALTEKELVQKIRHCLQTNFHVDAHTPKITITKITLPGGKTVFKGTTKNKRKSETLYATVISRKPTCDVCHGIHFIVAFNLLGVIKDFVPLHLTKYGNALWSATDTQFMQKKLVGQSVMNHLQFSPKIDAVSMATMTSAIIFNSINKLRETVEELQRIEK